MMVRVLGFIGCVALYLGATWFFLSSQASLIRGLPMDWREVPELRDRYASALSITWRDAVMSGSRGRIEWFIFFVVTFAVLSVLKFTIGFELTFAGVLALVYTAGEADRIGYEARQIMQKYDLEWPQGHRGLRALRASFRLTLWFGFLGSACCAGSLLALPLH
jgi:hypothetical protein